MMLLVLRLLLRVPLKLALLAALGPLPGFGQGPLPGPLGRLLLRAPVIIRLAVRLPAFEGGNGETPFEGIEGMLGTALDPRLDDPKVKAPGGDGAPTALVPMPPTTEGCVGIRGGPGFASIGGVAFRGVGADILTGAEGAVLHGATGGRNPGIPGGPTAPGAPGVPGPPGAPGSPGSASCPGGAEDDIPGSRAGGAKEGRVPPIRGLNIGFAFGAGLPEPDKALAICSVRVRAGSPLPGTLPPMVAMGCIVVPIRFWKNLSSSSPCANVQMLCFRQNPCLKFWHTTVLKLGGSSFAPCANMHTVPRGHLPC
mmetsp:Transcript_26920/g.77565  ORF Transcript_26920/g.77565 Transcript_26920/m.77565 type:complete len:311 (+) Transcript_26920:808-1740(+)